MEQHQRPPLPPLKNKQYSKDKNQDYWFYHEQDFNIVPYITEKNINQLKKINTHRFDVTTQKVSKDLKILKCKQCGQVILHYYIREYCSDGCLHANMKQRPSSYKMRRDIKDKYNIDLIDRYRYIDDKTIEYKPRPWLNRVTYIMDIEEVVNIYNDKAKRTLYGEMMNKFYKIYKLQQEDWNDEKIEELIQDVFDWLAENEDHVTITEYFRKHLINPLVLKYLKDTFPKFKEFFEGMEVYSESIVINKSLKGDFNGNFAEKYLKSRYPNWEEKSNNLSISQLPVIINLPQLPEGNGNERPKILGEIVENNDKNNLIEGENLEEKGDDEVPF